jgi:hypothetical protein
LHPVITIDVLVEWDERLDRFMCTGAEERYNWLLKNKPDLLGRVLDKYIAAFLGLLLKPSAKSGPRNSKNGQRKRYPNRIHVAEK